MPRGDGTGPAGMGPLTGRGAGYCAGFAMPGYTRAGGCYCGTGRRYGFRRWNHPIGVAGRPWFGFYGAYGESASPADEQTALKNQIRFYEERLEQVKKQLTAMEEKADG